MNKENDLQLKELLIVLWDARRTSSDIGRDSMVSRIKQIGQFAKGILFVYMYIYMTLCYRIDWYDACTNQNAASGYVSRTKHIPLCNHWN